MRFKGGPRYENENPDLPKTAGAAVAIGRKEKIVPQRKKRGESLPFRNIKREQAKRTKCECPKQ